MELTGKIIIFKNENEAKVWFEAIKEVELHSKAESDRMKIEKIEKGIKNEGQEKSFETNTLKKDLMVALNNWYHDLGKMKYRATKNGCEPIYPTSMFHKILKKYNLTLEDLDIYEDYLNK